MGPEPTLSQDPSKPHNNNTRRRYKQPDIVVCATNISPRRIIFLVFITYHLPFITGILLIVRKVIAILTIVNSSPFFLTFVTNGLTTIDAIFEIGMLLAISIRAVYAPFSVPKRIVFFAFFTVYHHHIFTLVFLNDLSSGISAAIITNKTACTIIPVETTTTRTTIHRENPLRNLPAIKP